MADSTNVRETHRGAAVVVAVAVADAVVLPVALATNAATRPAPASRLLGAEHLALTVNRFAAFG
jgi:hypothetical protein